MRPWPAEGIAARGWRIEPPSPTRLLADGDEIDLGDRVLRVLHTPGHAPDHICLLDERAGILWAQDQAYYGPHLVYEPGADFGDFVASTRRLADELRGSLRTVYTAHCLRPTVPPAFLGELADAAEAVAGGEAPLTPSRGLLLRAGAQRRLRPLLDPAGGRGARSVPVTLPQAFRCALFRL